MLTIIIGIVVAVIFVWGLWHLCKCEESMVIVFLIGLTLVIGAIVAGVSSPLSGYKEWELIGETELISLSNDIASGGTGMLYVSLSANNVYTYRYEINSEFGTETSREYMTTTLTGGGVEEIEDPNCEVPLLRVYHREAKRTIWTFGVVGETKYVFYVPEGTIYKEVKLN